MFSGTGRYADEPLFFRMMFCGWCNDRIDHTEKDKGDVVHTVFFDFDIECWSKAGSAGGGCHSNHMREPYLLLIIK